MSQVLWFLQIGRPRFISSRQVTSLTALWLAEGFWNRCGIGQVCRWISWNQPACLCMWWECVWQKDHFAGQSKGRGAWTSLTCRIKQWDWEIPEVWKHLIPNPEREKIQEAAFKMLIISQFHFSLKSLKRPSQKKISFGVAETQLLSPANCCNKVNTLRKKFRT